MQTKSSLVPEQVTGFEKNVRESVRFDRVETAVQFFKVARERLLDINNWHNIAEGLSSTFQLTDKHGELVQHRPPQVGDHLMIDIPGSSAVSAEGYDWVQIEAMEDRPEALISMRVRPAPSPLNKKPEPAHFLDEAATSTFLVFREDNQVIAEVHGRNENANTDVEPLLDKVRNLATALGSWLGLSDLQWKKLVQGLVRI